MPSALALKTEGVAADLQQRALGAYIGLAIGDALGATTEFMTPAEIRDQWGVHESIQGGGWLKLKPGQVTDDTEMSLALGDSILRNHGIDAVSVAESFSDWMRGKPVDIGHTVRRGLIHFRQTGNTEVPENEHDAGNGACMRSLPIALYYYQEDPKQWRLASRLQSHITHNNPVADAGTETLLSMIIAALMGNDKKILKHHPDGLIQQYPEYRFDRRRVENPSGWIIETLQVVWQAFFEHDDFKTTLVDVVNRGGDADTTGAISGMLCGAFYGLPSIPEYWIKALDKNVKKRCEQQALALVNHDSI